MYRNPRKQRHKHRSKRKAMHLTSIDERPLLEQLPRMMLVARRLMGIVLVSRSAVRLACARAPARIAGIRACSNNGRVCRPCMARIFFSADFPPSRFVSPSFPPVLFFSMLAYYYRFLRSRGSFVTWCRIVISKTIHHYRRQ